MKADVFTYFTYDNDGNQTSKKVGDSLCYYSYDPDNMLTTFTEGETDAEYVYDASPGIRRRAKAVVDGTVTYYAFDGLNVLADYDGDVSAQRTFVVPFLDDSLVLRTGGNDYHYTLDALGSVANLLDGNEAVQNDYLYEAFGSPHGTPTQNVTNRLRYTGREWDPTSSLYQYRARWYAPALGRFTSRDPRPDPLGLNLYPYVGNAPPNSGDPTGLNGPGTSPQPPQLPSGHVSKLPTCSAANVGQTLVDRSRSRTMPGPWTGYAYVRLRAGGGTDERERVAQNATGGPGMYDCYCYLSCAYIQCPRMRCDCDTVAGARLYHWTELDWVTVGKTPPRVQTLTMEDFFVSRAQAQLSCDQLCADTFGRS